jgi:hypothetical protein
MQKSWFSLWLVSWPITVILFLYPINNLLLRCGLILSLLGWLAGCLYFSWSKPIIRFAILLSAFVITGFLICPGRNYTTESLRTAYVASLRSFEGTRYIWGGENKRGIDCSGLVRAGLIKASWQQGLET